MPETLKDSQVNSGTVQAWTNGKRADGNIHFDAAAGELTAEQIEDLEDELFRGFGPPDNPDSPRYFVTLKKADGTERLLKVTLFRVLENKGAGWVQVAWTTPELRQKLAEWSAEWPKQEDTRLNDLLESHKAQKENGT